MRSLLLLSVVLTLLQAPCWGQLDLPSKSPVPKEEPSEAQPELERVESGDLAPRPEGQRGGLALPGERRLPAPVSAEPEPDPRGYSADPSGALTFVFDQLAGIRDPDSALALQAVEHLGALGEVGLRGAREALAQDHLPTLLAGARTLLRFGAENERRAVAARMRSSLPKGAAGILVRELSSADPILAGPELWASLLDHPQASMRKAAHRELSPLNGENVPFLQSALRSRRSDTRWLAVDLLGEAPADVSARPLIAFLGDPVAKVASHASQLLATRFGDEIVPELREQALRAPLSRSSAYALLSLGELEELHDVAFLGDEDIEVLLGGLGSSVEVVSAASAIALAGIGFRSERSREMDWLDRQVPHTLVRLSSGALFFKDFASVRSLAQRRLGLLSGQTFGSEGPAWLEWWAQAAAGFRSRRAVLDLRSEDSRSLRLRFLEAPEGSKPIQLAGTEAEVGFEPAFFLTEPLCSQVLASLEGEGVFGPERLPVSLDGAREVRGLEVTLGRQQKRFEFRVGQEPPWFLRLRAMAEELARAQRWQLYPNPDLYASQREYFDTEAAWWLGEAEPLERHLRLKRAILSALPAWALDRRDSGVSDLEQLYGHEGVADAADFHPLLQLLTQEKEFGPRARSLTDLCLGALEQVGELEPGVDVELAREVLGVLEQGFSSGQEAALEHVLRRSDPAVAEEASRSSSGRLRRAAAIVLGERGGARDRARLMELLEDADPQVERAAVRMLGQLEAEESRTEILVRARVGSPGVRSEALLAAASLGGEDIFELFVLGLSDDEPEVQRASLRGLAETGDPRGAHLLASAFSEGQDSALFDPARRGLLRLGEVGWPALFRQMLSPETESRRNAALLLAEQGAPESATTLLALLTDDPTDARVAYELAVLSGVDHRGAGDPASAWWGWWDLVVHDDAKVWLCSAAERAGHPAPDPDGLRGPGTRAGAFFLLGLIEHGEPHLAERARRELGRLLGRELSGGVLGGDRREWLDGLSVEIDHVYGNADR